MSMVFKNGPGLLRACCAVFLMFALFASVSYAHNPPKGIDWKEDMMSGKADAAARKVPIFLYVADDNANSDAVSKALQDAKVQAMLRNFACVFLSKSYNLQKFQSSYVPFIGVTPQTTFSPPVITFGDPAGNPDQSLRIEGKSVLPGELLKQLEKALQKHAPDKAKQATGKALGSMGLEDYVKRLGASVDFLEQNMSSDTAIKFLEELKSALDTAKSMKSNLSKIEDRSKKAQAQKDLREFEKYLKKLTKFRGKEKETEKFQGYLGKMREYFDKIASLVQSVANEMETFLCKAVPFRTKAASGEEVESAIAKMEFIKDVSFQEDEQTVSLGGEEVHALAFTIACRKGRVKKSDIAGVMRKLGYKAEWQKEDK